MKVVQINTMTNKTNLKSSYYNKGKKHVVVHIEDYFDPSAGYQINELLMLNIKYQDEVHLITSTDMSPFHKDYDEQKDIEFSKKYNVIIHRLEKFFKFSYRIYFRGLFKKIKNINPDLVFLHSIGDFKDLVLWKKKKDYIIVRDCHMSWVASKNKLAPIFYKLFKFFFTRQINNKNKYEKVYALGVEEKEYLKKLGIKEHKIDMLPHGYNDDIMYFSTKERELLRKTNNIEKDTIVISYIGKFNDSKEPHIIFDILDKVKENFKDDLVLYFIGPKSDKYMEKFYEKSKKHLKHRLIISDAVPYIELYKHFSMSDICIFPKETSLSSIHAQVCGCEVIMENQDSNKERVVNQDNLYNIDDLDQAARILERIIINKEYLNRNKYIDELKNREYSNQVKKLRQLIIDKRKEKK